MTSLPLALEHAVHKARAAGWTVVVENEDGDRWRVVAVDQMGTPAGGISGTAEAVADVLSRAVDGARSRE